MNSRPQRSTRAVAVSLLRLTVAVGVLGYLSTRIPLADISRILGRSQALYLIAALAVSLSIQWIVAYRLKLVARALGGSMSTSELLCINLTTCFYGLFLPGGSVTGFAIRFYRLASTEKQVPNSWK